MLLLSRDDREHGDGVITGTSACGSGKTVDAEYVGQGARGVCFAMGRGGGDEYGHPFRAFAKARRSVTGGCGPTDEYGEVFVLCSFLAYYFCSLLHCDLRNNLTVEKRNNLTVEKKPWRTGYGPSYMVLRIPCSHIIIVVSTHDACGYGFGVFPRDFVT